MPRTPFPWEIDTQSANGHTTDAPTLPPPQFPNATLGPGFVPPPPGGTLDAGDVGYHQFLTKQSEQLPTMRQQMQQLAQAIERVTGAENSWMSYVAQKYSLVPGDHIDPDGTIRRQQEESDAVH